ncbi:MAG: type II/IV secretion system protein [Sedimentisphaerales bacterium]|nr:type II/IV secretion system protein [Sedimentisphaerales bacterium]
MALSDNKKDSCEPKTDARNVVSLVRELLDTAVESGASDVHFEPTESGLVVKFRLDGVLNPVERLPKGLSDMVIARLKVLGGLLTYRNDIPQEGRILTSGGNTEIVADQRLAVFPTIHGQRAVVRLFYKNKGLTDLGQLGFSDKVYEHLKKFGARSEGVLLLTGPAGSGKSTTMAAVLRYIMNRFTGKSIVTLEDPVEIRLDGATQVQITPHGELTYPTALRSLLRQDPQVVMIGEIRDAETAKIAVEAGLTGHLLMSTLHSGTPAGAFLRLLEMGIEPYQVTSSVSAVLNQRLVRRLCPECKQRDAGSGLYGAIGCETCFNTGYKGRVLIAELVELDGSLREAILAKADIDQLEKVLAEKGHTNLLEDGRRLIKQGITTEEELSKACGV